MIILSPYFEMKSLGRHPGVAGASIPLLPRSSLPPTQESQGINGWHVWNHLARAGRMPDERLSMGTFPPDFSRQFHEALRPVNVIDVDQGAIWITACPSRMCC
jgi:hypothetical protein